ncbi:hypothetical protein RKE25_20590 [Dyella sp. BiH032]|uniref:hypothetical protein n=1 Tax=Dyella sp. BiH032 TaxID=3075430 RepID=UPI00289370FB|nr:hypothetical protein [Dyella sp. BiH032]WNL45780.1 hypothetical protein RKE25_20590 [Dyella sp. BiH032]
MRSLWLAWLAFGTANPPPDPCHSLVPPELERKLEERYPDVRLRLAADSDAENLRYATKQGKTCLLVAQADADGDGRADLALVLPKKAGVGYRFVVALNKPSGFELRELNAWTGPVTRLYVDVAPPGTYEHTEAYPFLPSPGVAETIVSKLPGFYFGTVESAAVVYFLQHDQWLLVHVMD